MLTVSSMGLDSIGLDSHEGKYWHIFAVGFNGTKVFFTEDEDWSEDETKKAESDDFGFVYDILSELLKSEESVSKLESSLLF